MVDIREDVGFVPSEKTPLPIFHRELEGGGRAFYAPGYLMVLNGAYARNLDLNQPLPAFQQLCARAQKALASWKALTERPFMPLCLTLYLNNECNLHCRYCFSMPQPHTAPRLEIDAIRAGGKIVARNCQSQGRPLTVVFHGGGEPSLHQDDLEAALDTVQQIAAEYGIPLFRYLATNGVMPEQRARWIATHIDLIGISCDGAPEIQGTQRPLRGGANSAPYLERTAQIIREAGKPLHVRVTLTPRTYTRQVEIADYICRILRPSEIHVEPVYGVGRGAPLAETWQPDDVPQFVLAFEEGRTVAAQYGVLWRTSGARLGDIHGAYCHLFRNVLNLVPGGIATACFCTSDEGTIESRGTRIGQREGASLALDVRRIMDMQAVLSTLNAPCEGCFNRFHCTHGCPEFCPLDPSLQTEGDALTNTFRCQVTRALAEAQLKREMAALQASSAYQTIGIAAKEINTL